MSAFALPIPPRPSRARFTGLRNAPLPRPEDSNQESVIRTAGIKAGEHPGNFPVLAPPPLGNLARDIVEVAAVEHPYLHFIGRTNGHDQKATKLRPRLLLPAEPLGQVGADRFRCPANLVGQGKLLDPRKLEARPMHLQR